MTRRKTWKKIRLLSKVNAIWYAGYVVLIYGLNYSSRTNHQPFQSLLRSVFPRPLLMLFPIRKEKGKNRLHQPKRKTWTEPLAPDGEAVPKSPFCHPLPIFSIPFHVMLQTSNKVKCLSTSWRFCVSHSSRLAGDNSASSAKRKTSTTVVREQTWKSIPDSGQMQTQQGF